MTKGKKNLLSNDDIINLSTNENKILNNWFSYNSTGNSSENLLNSIMESVYNVKVDVNKVVIGTDLYEKYSNLLTSEDFLFNLRDSIGVNLELLVIQNDNIRQNIKKEVNQLIVNNFDKNTLLSSKNHVKEILDKRWRKISEVADSTILNNKGSFLYLSECNIPNVITHKQKDKERINLLCSEKEFDSFIKRWKLHKLTSCKKDTLV